MKEANRCGCRPRWFAAVWSFVLLGLSTGPVYAQQVDQEAEEPAEEKVGTERESGGDAADKPGDKGAEEADEEMSDAERKQWRKERNKARAAAIRGAAGPNGWLERSWTWDFNVDLGWGQYDSTAYMMSRVRTGIVRVAEPNAYTIGVTGEYLGGERVSIGAQLEMLSLHMGTFVQAGGAVDVDGNPIVMAGVGWQIFGLEVQYDSGLPAENGRWLGMLKARLPISWFIRGVTE